MKQMLEEIVEALKEAKILSPAADHAAYLSLGGSIVQNINTLLEHIPKERAPDDWMIAIIAMGTVFRETGPEPIRQVGEKIGHLALASGLQVIEKSGDN